MSEGVIVVRRTKTWGMSASEFRLGISGMRFFVTRLSYF
jgi:hypothetical protein